jgi:3-methyladenine DNA glycosylase AlkD
MTYKQAMAALKKAGTAQNRKIYGKHGVRGEMFGVSFAVLKTLKKTIKQDHDLAAALWQSGNHDARVLACMVADADAFTSRDLDAMARDLDSYVIADAFSSMVARGRHRLRKAETWSRRKGEWVGAAGWNLIASQANHDVGLTDAWCRERLKEIEAELPGAKNRVRHSMNQALICIGARNAKLEKAALAAARRIGVVEVDHGDTSCRTPDAAGYIAKTKAHRARKARA